MARRPPGLEGRRSPTACGAIGAVDPGIVDGIAAALGGGLREVHRDHRSLLRLDRAPIRWRGDDGAQGVAWNESLPVRGHGARGWRQAAVAGCCGLILDGERRALHGSGSGVGPIYWTTKGDATYFATRVEPLAGIERGSPSPDWETWASIITLGYACGDGTPFAEIKRLDPLGVIDASAGTAPRVGAGGLAWAEVEPDDRPGLATEVIARLGEEIDGLDPERPLICPLTGGFDSRLVACLLAKRDRDFVTFTVNNDQGNDREEDLAAAVATELGIPHSVIERPASSFPDDLRRGAELVEHEGVLRPHLARLGAALPDPSAGVVDGFDIFLKNRFATAAVLEARPPRGAAATMFAEMTPELQRFPIFAPERWEALRRAAIPRWVDGADRFDGHANAATLIPYWHRMRRGISLSPTVLIGHRHEVAMPLVSHDVVCTALRASQRAKQGRAFYRQVLELVNPSVARLPSTNDALPRPERTRRRLDRSRRARRLYLQLLAECPLRPWFHPELESAIERGRLGPVLRTGWGLGRIHALCNLTIWAQRHGESLADLDPSPLFA